MAPVDPLAFTSTCRGAVPKVVDAVNDAVGGLFCAAIVSLAVSFAVLLWPPPDTRAEADVDGTAVLATATMASIFGKLPLGPTAAVLVHEVELPVPVQLQPVPA